MNKPRFVYVSYIGTTPEKLWDALTRGELTKAYWYDRRIESEWKVGAPVRFYDGDSDVLTDSGEVLEADRPRRLSYTFRTEYDAPNRDERYSRVTFTIEPHDEMVKLTLVHDELPDEETAEAFQQGWAPILSSLKTYLETGVPMPRIRALQEHGRPRGRRGVSRRTGHRRPVTGS